MSFINGMVHTNNSGWTLLWENDGTTSMASGTVLSCPGIQNYKYIAATLKYNATATSGDDAYIHSIGIFPIRSNGCVELFAATAQNSELKSAIGCSMSYRNCTVGEDTLTLLAGRNVYMTTGGTLSSSNGNARAIPMKIWGLNSINGFDDTWYDA